MDKKQASWTKQAGVTPGKLVLIGVLAAVLAGVLYIQYAPQGRSTPAVAAVNQPALPAATAAGSPTAPAAGQVAVPPAERKKTGAVANWHAPDFERVVAYDPFALPAAFPKPPTPEEAALAQSTAASSEDAAQRQAELEAARAQTENELSGLKQQAVKVMITRNDEFVAIVGDQVVHVGDELNGFRVIAIDSDGVHVAKDLTP
ncbi:MAG: hypothetical protein AB7G28_13800 [Pirellulales bacterium]